MSQPRWLDESEERAWRGYRRMRALLDLQISRDLAADSGLSDADYDVLSNLSEATGPLRLNELAALMLWSKSRLSHHITRMRDRGLVERSDCPSDARGAVLVLTDEGWRVLRAAAPLHVESVRRNFIDLLSAPQIEALAEAAAAVVDHLSGPDDKDRAIVEGYGRVPQSSADEGAARDSLREAIAEEPW